MGSRMQDGVQNDNKGEVSQAHWAEMKERINANGQPKDLTKVGSCSIVISRKIRDVKDASRLL
ncbi:MAG TPA: hypothetical protein VJT08_03005, partial [Terriglobales bacterium]|nr:hypothetical protein [Terriglobales bacterium]